MEEERCGRNQSKKLRTGGKKKWRREPTADARVKRLFDQVRKEEGRKQKAAKGTRDRQQEPPSAAVISFT